MASEPSAGTAGTAVIPAHEVVGVATANRRRAVSERDRASIDQLLGAEKPRVHGLERTALVGQFAVEEGRSPEVEADTTGGAERAERRPDDRPRQLKLRGDGRRLDHWFAVQMLSDGVDRLLVSLGQVAQDSTLAGEAAVELGAQDEDDPGAVEDELPSTRLRAPRPLGLRPIDAQPPRERQQSLEQP